MGVKNKVQLTTTLTESDLNKLKEISGNDPLNKVLSKWIELSDNKGNIAPSRYTNFKSRGNPIDNMVSAINLIHPGYFLDIEIIFTDNQQEPVSGENKVIFLKKIETLDFCANKVLSLFLNDKIFADADKINLRYRVNEIFKTINALEV